MPIGSKILELALDSQPLRYLQDYNQLKFRL